MALSEESVVANSSVGGNGCLDFEKPLAELESQIAELQSLQAAKGIDYSPEVGQLRSNYVKLTDKIYRHLSAWEVVQVARHPRRPQLADYLSIMVKDFRELHGDRRFGNDKAIVTGFGRIGREKVMLVGHNKGRNTKEKVDCNFGCAHPEGYRKALRKMQLAEKFDLPVVCLIDTPAAYPGVGAEERGQAQAIAENLMVMSCLRVPVICVIVSEGGSGGALGIGVGDRVAMMEFAWYAVAPPEACAAILWRTGEQAPAAANALKLTAKDLLDSGVIDEIIPESLGGAHRNCHEAAHNLEVYLVKTIRELRRFKVENLLQNRYLRLRGMGDLAVDSKPAKHQRAAGRTIGGGVQQVGAKRPARRKAVKA